MKKNTNIDIVHPTFGLTGTFQDTDGTMKVSYPDGSVHDKYHNGQELFYVDNSGNEIYANSFIPTMPWQHKGSGGSDFF